MDELPSTTSVKQEHEVVDLEEHFILRLPEVGYKHLFVNVLAIHFSQLHKKYIKNIHFQMTGEPRTISRKP